MFEILQNRLETDKLESDEEQIKTIEGHQYYTKDFEHVSKYS